MPLDVGRDINSDSIFDLPNPPDEADYYELTAATQKVISVPTGMRFFSIDCPDDYWVQYDGAGAVTIPSGDVSDGTAPERNPGQRYCAGVAQLKVICAIATTLQISWWQ